MTEPYCNECHSETVPNHEVEGVLDLYRCPVCGAYYCGRCSRPMVSDGKMPGHDRVVGRIHRLHRCMCREVYLEVV